MVVGRYTSNKIHSSLNPIKFQLTMESTLSASASAAVIGLSKTLNYSTTGAQILRSQLALLNFRRITTATKAEFRRSTRKFGSATPLFGLRNVGGGVSVVGHRLACVSSSAASFASGGGGAGGGVYGGGSGGGGGDGGEVKVNPIAVGADEVSAFSSDVIILDVGGMTCGGCAASVKRILESRPLVSSASVNLTTETAIVWPVSEAKDTPNWQKVLGEELAKHLTTCGFNSNLRDSKKESAFQTFQRKVEEKRNQLKQSGRGLAVSWALCAVCLFGHVSHFIGAKAWWIHAMHSTGFHLSLSLFTLLVPGRQLIIDGMKSLLRGTPNMNTLVGLGAISSFTVSSFAALIPKLGWKVFFEEPIMLIAFVLLGRNLEQRAKIKATSDMTGLLSVLPRVT